MGQRGPTKEFPHRVPVYLDPAGLEKLDALPGDSRSQKVRDMINKAYETETYGEMRYPPWWRKNPPSAEQEAALDDLVALRQEMEGHE